MTNYEKMCILTEKKARTGLSDWESALLDAMEAYCSTLSKREQDYWEDLPFDTDKPSLQSFNEWWEVSAVDYDYLAFGSHFDKAIAESLWSTAFEAGRNRRKPK